MVYGIPVVFGGLHIFLTLQQYFLERLSRQLSPTEPKAPIDDTFVDTSSATHLINVLKEGRG